MLLFTKNIHYLSVIAATVVAGVFNALWYSPLLFGPIWMESPFMADPSDMSALVIFPSIAIGLINAYVVHGLASFCGLHGLREGFVLSLWLGAGLMVLNMLGGYMFVKVSPEMAAVDAGSLYMEILIYCLFATLWYKKA